MAHKFHFISGLPRSGSTLMAALLRQNKRFHASMSGPVASLFEGIVGQVSAGSELSTMVTEEQRARILKWVFHAYYADRREDVIFDTNRSWTAKMPALAHLFPDAKFICCVRDVAWIMDSMERQFRQNAFENTRLFNTPGERATVYTRLEALANANRLVGFPYHALREACWGEFAEKLIIIDYDLLVARPAEVLPLIYQFIGEEPFAHDFENVEYDAPEFDGQLGVSGLHTVHKKVEARPRTTILPPDLFARYSNMAFWRDLQNCKAFRIVNQPAEGQPAEGQAAGGQATQGLPAEGQQTEVQPSERQLADQPLADQPLADQPLADQRLADQQLADQTLANAPPVGAMPSAESAKPKKKPAKKKPTARPSSDSGGS